MYPYPDKPNEQNMIVEPFKRLVKLAARAFYDDVTTKADNQAKTGRSDNRGIAVVVLDALTRRQWVREEDFAKDLKMHAKQLRRTLRYFEEEKLINRENRRETAKGAKVFSAAIAAVADGQRGTKEGEEKIKMHTHSYCCLDYAQVHDVVRYRLHRMKKMIKDELDDKNTIQEYMCPSCKKSFNALDASRLISFEDEYFHCEKCNGVLVAQSDMLAAQDGGDGDDNARRLRREKLKDMLQNMEIQLKPLMEQLNRVKDLSAPNFGTLQAWEAQANAAARPVNGDSGPIDSFKSAQGIYGTPMPFLGETKVEVSFSETDVIEADNKSGSTSTPRKPLPPWMITEGMKLTEEQRGEVKQEKNFENSSVDVKDDKKATVHLQVAEAIYNLDYGIQIHRYLIYCIVEYFNAWYTAIMQKQDVTDRQNVQVQKGISGTSSHRQVGLKVKREDNEEDHDDGGWVEAPSAGKAKAGLMVDLNVEADALEDDDDGSDWEDGDQ